MSPPLSEGTASPVFNEPPISRGGDLMDEGREEFGLFNENVENVLELNNDCRHVESTPKRVNIPLNKFDLKHKDSPSNYEQIINLVKDQNKKDLSDLEDLRREIYNQPKPSVAQKHRVDWDPIVKMGEESNTYNKEPVYNQPKPSVTQKHRVDWDPSIKMGESSNTYNKEPVKTSQVYKLGKRKTFNYPTPSIFDPKTSNADQFVSTFNNFSDWNDISMRERAQLFQSYLSPKTF